MLCVPHTEPSGLHPHTTFEFRCNGMILRGSRIILRYESVYATADIPSCPNFKLLVDPSWGELLQAWMGDDATTENLDIEVLGTGASSGGPI